MTGFLGRCACLWAIATGVLAADFDPWLETATYHVDYVIDLTVLPDGEEVRLWVPLPVINQDQQVTGIGTDSPWTITEITDNRGNQVAEILLPAGERSTDTLSFHYEIERSPSVGLGKRRAVSVDDPAHFLGERVLIPLGGVIADIANEQKQGLSGEQELARGFYDYVYASMTYSKEGEGWGQGDAVWACHSKYGNCTDFHSLYIGMIRSQGIPARFKIGFPLSAGEESGRHDGYHCWAEVYLDDKGWIPLDASEAKKSGLRDEYFGRLPSDRIEFSQGRDLVMSENQRGKPINYFIYPYAESESAIVDRLPVKLTYRRIKSRVSSSEEHIRSVHDNTGTAQSNCLFCSESTVSKKLPDVTDTK